MREEIENAYGNDMEDLGRPTNRLEHLHYPNKSGTIGNVSKWRGW